jgi:hypothetical protein
MKRLFLSFVYYPVHGLCRRILFIRDYVDFKKKSSEEARFSLNWSDRRPELDDHTPATHFDTHYIYHPAWAARILAKTKPKEHIDISSALSFPSIVSAFLPVRFYDYRPAHLLLTGLTTDSTDLLQLPFADGSITSLSCMHTVEHIGLGRYGDPLDPAGDKKAAKELARVLARGGNLLFVVPVGKPRIAFNAHRIYSYAHVHELFPDLVLKQCSLVPDDALSHGMIENATEHDVNAQTYGCGCFWFVKE